MAAKKKATTRKTANRKATARTATEPVKPKAAANTTPQRKGATKAESPPRAPAAAIRARGPARRSRTGAEQPNLEELTRLLRDRVTSRVPSDYVRGKTRLRDEVMSLLACSSARAEHIVDSMVARGYARFGRHPRFTTDPRFGIWHLDDRP